MKTEHSLSPHDIDMLLEHAHTDGQRQRALEALRADTSRRLVRRAALRRRVLTACLMLLMVPTAALMQRHRMASANTPDPEIVEFVNRLVLS